VLQAAGSQAAVKNIAVAAQRARRSDAMGRGSPAAPMPIHQNRASAF
jgi:hypothetical protein